MRWSWPSRKPEMDSQESTVFSHASGVRLVVSRVFNTGKKSGREGLYVVVDHPAQAGALWRTFVGPVGATPQEDIDAAMQVAQAVAKRQLREWQRQWFGALVQQGLVVQGIQRGSHHDNPMPPAPATANNKRWQRQVRFKE